MSAPIIVTALFGLDDFSWLQGLRRAHYPPERNLVPAHLTLFSHLPPSAEREIGARLSVYAQVPPPHARLAGLIDLGGGTAFRVESDELEDLRADLAVALHGLLAAQDKGRWTPLVTIQNKVDPREAKRLQQSLRANFELRPLVIKGLASWHYLGGPWQPLRTYSFRG